MTGNGQSTLSAHILGVHGFNDHSKAFEPLAQHLSAELGATLYTYDQRGGLLPVSLTPT